MGAIVSKEGNKAQELISASGVRTLSTDCGSRDNASKDIFTRTWQNTGLGDAIEQGEKHVSSDGFVFNLISYNVLAEYLAQRHPELYKGIRNTK